MLVESSLHGPQVGAPPCLSSPHLTSWGLPLTSGFLPDIGLRLHGGINRLKVVMNCATKLQKLVVTFGLRKSRHQMQIQGMVPVTPCIWGGIGHVAGPQRP